MASVTYFSRRGLPHLKHFRLSSSFMNMSKATFESFALGVANETKLLLFIKFNHDDYTAYVANVVCVQGLNTEMRLHAHYVDVVMLIQESSSWSVGLFIQDEATEVTRFKP